MSVREVFRIFHQFDPGDYLAILQGEHGATPHPTEPGAYLVEDLPFYEPKTAEDYVFVTSFNYAPLPGVLIEALAEHTELVPDEALIVWLIEQDSWFETTLGEVRQRFAEMKAAKSEMPPQKY